MNQQNIIEIIEKSTRAVQVLDSFDKSVLNAIDQMTIPIRMAQENLRRSMTPILEMQESINRMFEPIRKVQEDISKQFAFLDHWLEINQELFKKISEVQLEYNKSEILLENGWIITPFLNTSSLKNLLSSLAISEMQVKKNKEYNKLYIDFFTQEEYKQLALLVKSWDSNIYFQKRQKLIKSTIQLLKAFRPNGHNKQLNPSSIIIPILIAQIDGITLEFALNNGLKLVPGTTKLTRIEDGKNVRKYDSLENNGVNSFHDISSLDLLQNYLFGKAYPMENPENNIKNRPFLKFNRHKIMHGENIDYGKIDNTIRLFLILDYLANLKSK